VVVANAVLKFSLSPKTQRLQQSYLMRAAMETEKLRALIEEIAKDVKKSHSCPSIRSSSQPSSRIVV
jgi:hypothetical protein